MQFLSSDPFRIQSKHSPELLVAMYTKFADVESHSIYDSIICDILSLVCEQFNHEQLCFDPVFMLKYGNLDIDFNTIEIFLKQFSRTNNTTL